MTIEEFIAAESVLPFRWGKTDCAATADRWVRAAAGVSPLAAYGRRYTNEKEAGDWLACPGSIAVALNRVMRAAGFAKTSHPDKGDVGLVVVNGMMCIGINTGTGWFSRRETGLIHAPLAAAWKAWRV